MNPTRRYIVSAELVHSMDSVDVIFDPKAIGNLTRHSCGTVLVTSSSRSMYCPFRLEELSNPHEVRLSQHVVSNLGITPGSSHVDVEIARNVNLTFAHSIELRTHLTQRECILLSGDSSMDPRKFILEKFLIPYFLQHRDRVVQLGDSIYVDMQSGNGHHHQQHGSVAFQFQIVNVSPDAQCLIGDTTEIGLDLTTTSEPHERRSSIAASNPKPVPAYKMERPTPLTHHQSHRSDREDALLTHKARMDLEESVMNKMGQTFSSGPVSATLSTTNKAGGGRGGAPPPGSPSQYSSPPQPPPQNGATFFANNSNLSMFSPNQPQPQPLQQYQNQQYPSVPDPNVLSGFDNSESLRDTLMRCVALYSSVTDSMPRVSGLQDTNSLHQILLGALDDIRSFALSAQSYPTGNEGKNLVFEITNVPHASSCSSILDFLASREVAVRWKFYSRARKTLLVNYRGESLGRVRDLVSTGELDIATPRRTRIQRHSMNPIQNSIADELVLRRRQAAEQLMAGLQCVAGIDGVTVRQTVSNLQKASVELQETLQRVPLPIIRKCGTRNILQDLETVVSGSKTHRKTDVVIEEIQSKLMELRRCVVSKDRSVITYVRKELYHNMDLLRAFVDDEVERVHVPDEVLVSASLGLHQRLTSILEEATLVVERYGNTDTQLNLCRILLGEPPSCSRLITLQHRLLKVQKQTTATASEIESIQSQYDEEWNTLMNASQNAFPELLLELRLFATPDQFGSPTKQPSQSVNHVPSQVVYNPPAVVTPLRTQAHNVMTTNQHPVGVVLSPFD
eukprot:PhF_6_TR35369/c0_g1_i1/m.51366